jgi:hypothetical protein
MFFDEYKMKKDEENRKNATHYISANCITISSATFKEIKRNGIITFRMLYSSHSIFSKVLPTRLD